MPRWEKGTAPSSVFPSKMRRKLFCKENQKVPMGALEIVQRCLDRTAKMEEEQCGSDFPVTHLKRNFSNTKNESSKKKSRQNNFLIQLHINTQNNCDPHPNSPITLANLSSINLVSIFRCSSPPRNLVYGRCVDPSSYLLVFHHTDTHTFSVYQFPHSVTD